MFTDPNHLRISDAGKIEGNVVFTYLDAFHSDHLEVSALKDHYQKGGLGDITIKNKLNDALQNLLGPIREKRETLRISDLKNILQEGTKKARSIAQFTMKQVRETMGLNYFNNRD